MNTPPVMPPPGGPFWNGIIGPARHLWPDGSWRDTPPPGSEVEGYWRVAKIDHESKTNTLEVCDG